MKGRLCQRPRFRFIAISVTLVLACSVLQIFPFTTTPASALATSSVLNEPFHNNTLAATGSLMVPTVTGGGTNSVCLTASGNTSVVPKSCAAGNDANGSGVLRLIANTGFAQGGMFTTASIPASKLIDATFNVYQWGSTAAGDGGAAFVIAASNPANPAPPANMGYFGGTLGYTSAGTTSGLLNGYLGIGFDAFGGYSNLANQGSGCPTKGYISASGQVPGQVVVKGPGTGTVGYCPINSTATDTSSAALNLHGATRAASKVPAEVVINPGATAQTTTSGLTVAALSYLVAFTPIGDTQKTLTGALPSAAGIAGYPAGYLNASGIPLQFTVGWVGSNGGSSDERDIDAAQVSTFQAATPTLTVSTNSYSATFAGAGDPVTYVATAGVAGGDENSAVTMTQTVPTGVVPVGAYGVGWVCQPASGTTITCTTSGSSFPSGTALPVLTITAIVTGSFVTRTTVQNSSTTAVSSTDATAGSDSSATTGTMNTAPSGVTVSPSSGPVGGGYPVTVTITSKIPLTAIEIGTSTEQKAGTPLILLPCPNGNAAGCFNLSGTFNPSGNSTYYILSMPARPAAVPAQVNVVALGVDTAVNFTYQTAVPATMVAPTAVPGAGNAVLSWVAPSANGAAITGYKVTPYIGGTAQTVQTFGNTAITDTVTGLTNGTAYTFAVAATNSVGTGIYSPQSSAVTPFTVPGVPTGVTAIAGSLQATVTWTAPSANGSAITGYVVTPFIGTTALAGQTFTGAATTQGVTGLTAGTAYTFTVAAQNAAGTGAASAKTAAVTPNVLPNFTFAAPPAGEVGAAYTTTLTVAGGTPPLTWSVAGGTLPGGLTLAGSTGILSGTPTAGGTFLFNVRVVDVGGGSNTRDVTLVIAPTPVVTFAPTAGEIGIPYSYQPPPVSGGTSPFAWSLTAGSLPAGVTLNATNGLLSGTPTASGTFAVTVTVKDLFNQSANKTASVVIAAAPTLTSAPVAGQVGFAYSFTFAATGGTAPFTYSLVAGTLPGNQTLSSAGVLSGAPAKQGSYPFTVRVVDAFGESAQDATTITVTPAATSITKTASVSTAASGTKVTFIVTATNSSTTITYNGVKVLDPLATDVLDDAGYNNDAAVTGGDLQAWNGSTLVWQNIALTPGSSFTMTYSVTVSSPDVGNHLLNGIVSTSFVSSNCNPGDPDSRCSAPVTLSGLTIAKTADAASTTPGSTVRYTVVVTNSGQNAYTGATFTDSLAAVTDDATYNLNAATNSGSVAYSSPSITWTGNLAVGASATITYSVTINNPDTGNKSLSGTIVSATPGSSCPSGSPAAACGVTVTVLVPALVIAMSAGSGTTIPGSVVTYTTTLTNSGQTAYTGITVTLSLTGAVDDGVLGATVTASAGSAVVNTGAATIVWTGNLALGAVVTVTGSVTVNNPDTGNKTLTAVVSSAAAGSTCPSGSSNTACTASVQVLVQALTISKVADVTSTTYAAVVHYTTTVTNSGQTAYLGATFADALAGVLDDANYNGDAGTTAGSVSFTSPTLTWTGDLAIGATAEITYSVTVLNPDPGDKSLTGTIVSSTTGSNCWSASGDARCTSTVTVLVPGLTLSLAVDTATTTPGSVLHYTISARNSGASNYTNVPISIDFTALFDDAVYNNDAAVSSGSLATSANTIWTVSLLPGATATGTVSFTVSNPDTGDKSMSTNVRADAPGSTCPTGSANTSCKTATMVLIPGLTITKTADGTTVATGGSVRYTVVVTNTGESAYPAATFTDSLAAVLDDAAYAGGATATSGSLSYAAQVLSWTGALAVGASATVTYAVRVNNPDIGDKLLVNAAVSTSAGSNCASGSTDTRCTSSVGVLVPGLTFVKTANASSTTPGAVVAYTVTVTNSGQTAYTAAVFDDSLVGVLDDATYNSNAVAVGGSVGYANSTVSWTGDLAIGASATVTYSVTVNAAAGDNLLSNTIVSATAGSNCTSGSLDARCTVVVPVARLLLVNNPNGTATPGSTFTLTATYTNTGKVPYTGISITTLGVDAADDAIPASAPTPSSGTLTPSGVDVTWTGSIAVGQVITVSGGFTVLNPDTGDKVMTTRLQSSAPGNNCPAGSLDVRCASTTTVLIPGLTFAASTNAPSTGVAPGTVVTYAVVAHNSGQTPYNGISFTDPLAGVLDDATYNGASATSGVVTFPSNVITWSGDLEVGASVTVTFSVTVLTPDPGDKAMSATVSSSAVGNNCLPASGAPACTAAATVLTPGLTIVKTANLTTATLGTTVTYTIQVTNSGQTPYELASFTDSLAGVTDDAAYNSDVTANIGTASGSGGVVTWSGALAVAQVATITYSVTINSPSTGNRTMANTIVSPSTGNNCLSGSGDSRCTATVTISNSMSLTFTRTADVATTLADAVVHYTVTAVNASTAAIDSNFTDALAGILDDATYTGTAIASAGTATFTDPNLSWTGTVPAGGTVTVTFSVTVNPTVTVAGDELLTDQLTSTAPAASNNCLSGSVDARCRLTVPVAALLIVQSYAQASTTPGSVVSLTGTFTNTGQVPYVGISVASPIADTFDDAVTAGNQVASSGALVVTSSSIIWTGDIAVGASVTITGTLTVKDPDPGNRRITGTLSTAAVGSNCPSGGSDPRCTALVTVLLPGLTITKAANVTTTVAGGVVGYTVTVKDTGETAYIGASFTDPLTGVLDDADYNSDVATTGGAVSYSGVTRTVSWSGDLAVGQTATITYSLTVKNPDPGGKDMANSVTSTTVGSNCPAASGNAACSSVVAVLTPALTIVKTANLTAVTLGSTVTYTVVVTNTGQTVYAAPQFSDPLTAVLDDAAYNNDQVVSIGAGAVSYDAPTKTVSWTGPATFAVGASATITYTVTVFNPDTAGDKSLTNTVTSTTPSNNCVSGSTDTRCTVTIPVVNNVALTYTNKAAVLTTVSDEVVSYTVTVVNSTAGAIPGNFTLPLTGITDDAVYNYNLSTTGGTAAFADPNVTWSGDVPAGGTVTVSFTVKVGASKGAAADQILESTVTSTSPAASNNCLAGSIGPQCISSVPIARLTIAQHYTEATTTPGSVIHLTGTFTNTGAVPYEGISVASPTADTVDDAMPNGDQTATTGGVAAGVLVLSGTAITWTGNIAVGAVVTITGTLTVHNPDTANKLITGTLVSAAPGNNCFSGSGDAACTATSIVQVPALTITKTASTTSAAPGTVVGFTITVHNTGQTAYTGAVVTDTLTGVLDDATYNGDATANGGVLVFSTPTLTWTGNLALGETVTIGYTSTVLGADNDLDDDKQMSNTVSSTAVGSTCPPGSTDPACTATVIVLTPALTIVNTGTPTSANLGTTVRFTVVVTNSGQTDYAPATFADNLAGVTDDAVYNGDAAMTGALGGSVAYDAATKTLTWSGPMIIGAVATITYTVTVRNLDAGGRSLVNTIASNSTGGNCDGSGDSRCTATIPVADSVAVTFSKTADVASTVAGAPVSYTVTMVNTSGADVAANFTDDLTGVLDDATYNVGSAEASGATFVTPNVSWSGTVSAGATATVTYSVTVHPAITGGNGLLSDTVVSGSPPESNNCLSGSLDPLCRSVVPVAALLIATQDGQSTTTPGSVVVLSVKFTNTGQVPYTNISISSPGIDVLDDISPVGNQVATSGTLSLSETAIVWTGSILVGQSVTITSSNRVNDPDKGNRLIFGTWVSSAPGNNCVAGSNDPLCVSSVQVLVPALSIVQSASALTVDPGGTVQYTIVLTNTGEAPYTGAVVTDSLAAVLDDGTVSDPTTTSGAVSFTPPTLTWTGDLALKQVVTITFTVTAANPDSGDKAMIATVVSTVGGSSCPPASVNADCTTVVDVLTPALTFSTAASAATSVPGGTITYTVTVTNSGQIDYPAAAFTIPLAGVTDDAVYNGATVGTVEYSGVDLTWSGPLATSATATITYSVTVNTPDTGDHQLLQTLSSTSAGNNCPAAGTDPRCSTSVLVASLSIAVIADVTTTKPTDVVHYTGTFKNTGAVPYIGIVIYDDVTGIADDTTYNGDATATSGTVRVVVGEPLISWTGDLAVGATVVFTISATINNPDKGDRHLKPVASTSAAGSNCALDSKDPLCSSDVEVLIPILTISKTANTTNTTPDSTVGYTVTITNTGPTAYTAATVSDALGSVLNDATYSGGATASSGGLAYAGQVLTWTGDLALGAPPVVITYSVTVDAPDLGGKKLVNTMVSQELGSTCPSGGTAPACTATVTVLIPALTISISANTTSTTPGSTVAYTMTIANNGQTDYAGASVTAALDGVIDDASFVSGTATIGTVSFTSPNLVWTGDLIHGNSTTVTYTVTVANPDVGDHSLLTSVSSAAAGGTCPPAAPCSNAVPVLTPALTVTATASVTTATPGDPVTFTITLHNGGQTVYTGTTVSTDLANVVDDASFDGTVTASSGVASYAAPTLSWTGSLAIGSTVTITYSVTVANLDPPGNRSMVSTVVAPGVGSSCLAGAVNPLCTATVTVLIPALTITKTVEGVTTTVPGGVVAYTITVANTGQTPYSGAVVNDDLTGVLGDADYNGNAGAKVGGATVGGLSYAQPMLTWTGDLAIGATATITYSITVHNPDLGDFQISNAVSSTAPGSTCPVVGAPAACSTSVRVLLPRLLITQTTNVATVVAGSPVTYTVTVLNNGETDYPAATFTDVLTGVLDDATYSHDASSGGVGTAAYDDRTHTLTWTGPLAIGTSATVTFTVITVPVSIQAPGTGNHQLTNAVLSAVQGSSCVTGAEIGCATAVTVLLPGLSIIKTTAADDNVVAGGDIEYTIVAVNDGQADYPAGTTITDSLAGLPAGMTYGNDATTTAGAIGFADGTLTWTGGLLIGATVTTTYSVNVDVTATATTVANRVVSAAVGSTCAVGSVAPGCVTDTPIAARFITLSGLTPGFTLTGIPNTTVTRDGAVTMTVTTNSTSGYFVTVVPEGSTLIAQTPGNTAAIPIANLTVRESGTGPFQALLAGSPYTVVHTQGTPSSPNGDAISNDFRLEIPFVPTDTYTGTLDYIVTAGP